MKVLNSFMLFSLLSTAVLSINMRRGVSAFTQLLHYEEVFSERLEIAGGLASKVPLYVAMVQPTLHQRLKSRGCILTILKSRGCVLTIHDLLLFLTPLPHAPTAVASPCSPAARLPPSPPIVRTTA